MSETLVNYSLQGTVAVIQMDDGKVNALSHAMLDQLDEALSQAEQEARAVVLTGRDGKFCAGFDLKVMGSSPTAARDLIKRGAGVFMRLYGLPIPLVIACSGHAVAGGALMVLCGDTRIASQGPFKMGLNEIAVGLPLPIVAIELARDRLSPTVLSAATLGAFIFELGDSVTAGFLDRIVPADSLLPEALEAATALGKYNPAAYRQTKERLRGLTIDYVHETLDEDLANFGLG